MPELRKDPISHRWVIIAQERARRPSDFKKTIVDEPPKFDPFAMGNETKTPTEIYAVRDPKTHPNSPGWRVRVVPNKYPALGVEGVLDKHGNGIYDFTNGIGAHEVIIETPDTARDIASYPEQQYRDVLQAYRHRLVDLARDHRLAYGMLFKNVGSQAGASLFHSHSQLIATPSVPIDIERKMENATAYYEFRGRSVFGDMVRQEIDDAKRLIIETDSFVAFEPYAPRFPFETWILPKRQRSFYEDCDEIEFNDLAHILRRTIRLLGKGLGELPYNMMLFSAPFRTHENPAWRWHIEIIPRLVETAGFEWGTGFYINTVPPEEAADYLKTL